MGRPCAIAYRGRGPEKQGPELSWTSVWELNLQSTPEIRGQLRILSLPHLPGSTISRAPLTGASGALYPVDLGALLWAGISTLAIAPGCCGFLGPVPSATLDKRCRLSSTGIVTKEPRFRQ